jgi:hypothetical protein
LRPFVAVRCLKESTSKKLLRLFPRLTSALRSSFLSAAIFLSRIAKGSLNPHTSITQFFAVQEIATLGAKSFILTRKS